MRIGGGIVFGSCVVCGKSLFKKTTYCSVRCWADKHTIPKEQLISNLRDLATKLGRAPTRRECAQFSSCTKAFGSWSKALLSAGLTPNRSLNQRMYKRRICHARDGHLCNSVSEMIIDNWLSSHNITHGKEVPYPWGKMTADWAIGKDTLVEYFGLAKDSEKYDRAVEKKRRLCQQAGKKLIEIYSTDLFPRRKLSQIFQAGIT